MIQYLGLLLIPFFFCLRIEAAASTQTLSAKEILSQNPREDSEILDQFFRTLILENYFAYTLFGTKPMTHKRAFYRVLMRECSKEHEGDYIFVTHGETWKKYASLPNFRRLIMFF